MTKNDLTSTPSQCWFSHEINGPRLPIFLAQRHIVHGSAAGSTKRPHAQCHLLSHRLLKYLRVRKRRKIWRSEISKRKKSIKLWEWVLSVQSYYTGLFHMFLPEVFHLWTSVVALFCNAKLCALLTPGYLKEHLISSAHQFRSYQSSFTIKCRQGTQVFKITLLVFKGLIENFIWTENHTATWKRTW